MLTEKEQQKRYAERILRSYAPRGESAADRLRRLDRKVHLPARAFAWTFGVVAALVLGVGMCLAMGVIGDLFAWGIVIGCVGIAMACVNYPIYRTILRSRKKSTGSRSRRSAAASLRNKAGRPTAFSGALDRSFGGARPLFRGAPDRSFGGA